MTPIQQFNRQLAQHQLLMPTKTLIVAVSTGVDSMVLLTLLQQLPKQQRPRLVVAHVNHHLREQSQAEAAFLAQYCQHRQLKLVVADWLPAQHPQTGIEAAGRQFRYDFFTKLLVKYDAAAVLTAHHANDQAETYLMKLARGGDLAQLTGIAASRPFATGQLVRPLLAWPKAQLRQYAQTAQVPFFEDATNQDVRLTRNRIRHRVVPELMKINPEFLAHVATYEQQLQTLQTANQQMICHLLPTLVTANQQLIVARWQQLPPAWRSPVLQAWIQKQTAQRLSTLKLAPIVHWIQNAQHPTGMLRLNPNVQLAKRTGIIEIVSTKKRVKKLMPGQKIMVDLNQWQKITATQTVGIFTQPSVSAAQPFPLLVTDAPLYWRPWQPTDQLALKGGGHQSVRRILINQKVPAQQRSAVFVLVNAQGTVLWVVGHKFSYRDRDTGTQTVFLALKHRS